MLTSEVIPMLVARVFDHEQHIMSLRLHLSDSVYGAVPESSALETTYRKCDDPPVFRVHPEAVPAPKLEALEEKMTQQLKDTTSLLRDVIKTNQETVSSCFVTLTNGIGAAFNNSIQTYVKKITDQISALTLRVTAEASDLVSSLRSDMDEALASIRRDVAKDPRYNAPMNNCDTAQSDQVVKSEECDLLSQDILRKPPARFHLPIALVLLMINALMKKQIATLVLTTKLAIILIA